MSNEDMEKIEGKKISQLFQLQVKSERDFEEFMHYFYEMGYLLASYQIENPDTTTCRFTLTLGEPYRWASLEQGNLPDEIFLKTGFKKNIFQDDIFNFSRITKLFRSVIQYSERHGHPFATIKLKEIEIGAHRINARLDYQPGPAIYFSGVKLGNKISLKSNFLASYLNTRSGMPFDQRKIDGISYRLRQLAFLRLKEKPLLLFRNDSCEIHLDLESVKANTFDGILGFLPNENEPDKLLITGQLLLGLDNLFRSGKKLNLEWQKPNLLTQELLIQYEHPALFKFPADLDVHFHLFKQDTSFINRDLHVFFFLKPGKFGSLGLNYTYMSSRLLSTGDFQQIQELDKVDYDISYYGIKYRLNTLDRLYFPTRGLSIEGTMQLGTKKILRNVGINDDSYEGLREKTFQLRSTLTIEKYFTLLPKNTILARVSAGYLDNDQLFFNDLFRLGGLNSIRGFNERNFFASWYLTGTIEYRYLFENDSQLFFFFDGSGLGYTIQSQSVRDHPFGFGGGFSLSTKAGLLHIIYALGKSSGQPLGLNNSKIHIGYSNRF